MEAELVLEVITKEDLHIHVKFIDIDYEWILRVTVMGAIRYCGIVSEIAIQ